MAKIDKSLYNKNEIKALLEKKRFDKAQKQIKKELLPIDLNVDSSIINVVCVKHGTKYNEIYPNTLYNMVKNNLSLPFNFFCITDNSKFLDKRINIIELPNINKLEGWWCKPYIFCKDLNFKGIVLYLDLDIVITNNINHLVQFCPNKFCIIRDFTRAVRHNWPKFNSSVMKFNAENFYYLWDKFHKSYVANIRKFHGDQDWIYEELKNDAQLFPDNWIKSWKWEIRKTKTFAPGGVKGNKKLQLIEHVTAPQDCCIAVFHGDPNPHNCEDPYIIEKWK